jgi:hypothetical protein
MYATSRDLQAPGLGAFKWSSLLSLLSLNLDLPVIGKFLPGFYIGLAGEDNGQAATTEIKAKSEDWAIVAIAVAVPFLAASFLAYHLPEQIRVQSRVVHRHSKGK